ALRTAGAQTITFTDVAVSSVTGQSLLTVNSGVATHYVFTAPAYAAGGAAFTLGVAAKDAYGNTVTGYRGTVHVTSSDSAASLPTNYTFTTADQGVHSFGVTLRTLGNQTVTATDTVNAALSSSTVV